MNSDLARGFTQRERQIAAAILQAQSVKEIASDLSLSINTVKDYLKTIYQKTDVHSARELMVKLYLAPAAAAPPPAPLPQLLQAMQRMLEEAGRGEILAQMRMAVQACTQAQKVSFCRVTRDPSGAALVGVEGARGFLPGPFLRQVLERGWGRWERSAMNAAEGRQLAVMGLGGEALGVKCSPLPQVQMMVMSEPREGVFAPLDLPTARLLARLAEPNAIKYPVASVRSEPRWRTMAAGAEIA